MRWITLVLGLGLVSCASTQSIRQMKLQLSLLRQAGIHHVQLHKSEEPGCSEYTGYYGAPYMKVNGRVCVTDTYVSVMIYNR